jgi:RNA polymerase sigma factor (sigma-70 family)
VHTTEENALLWPRFASLMRAVRAGDDRAAEEIVQLYGHEVLILVRRRLGGHLRRRYESQDFTQNVWASFFAHRERLEGIDSPEALAGFLARLARNKVVTAVRENDRLKRGAMAIEEVRQDDDASLPEPATPAAASVSKVIIADELWDRLLSKVGEKGRQILELRRLGLSVMEVAERLGIHERTVRRLLDRLRVD